MNKEIQNWLKMVDYDLSSAKHMLETRRYLYVVFMCHIALEKCLKALVAVQTKQAPPKTHDLVGLIKLAKIDLNDEDMKFIVKFNNASVATRYPEDFPEMVASYPNSVTKEYFRKTQELIKWLRKDKRLKK